MNDQKIILGVKCAPDEKIFSDVCRAGLEVVELYLSKSLLGDVSAIINKCRNSPLRYAVHAPNDGYGLDEVVELTREISAKVVVFHDVYWEDEWAVIIKRFKETAARLCIENTHSVHEPLKFMRRYGLGNCLDLEHAQMQCTGLYEKELINTMRKASHIHMTGYKYGTKLWHTHLHHSPGHSRYLLNLLEKAEYSGFLISEARVSFQNFTEFNKLKEFYERWKQSKIKKTHSCTD